MSFRPAKRGEIPQNRARQARSKFIILVLLWLITFALALAWRSQNLDAFGLSNDEGAHLMWARLAVDGYPLYSQTYAVQPPLFLEMVGLGFRLAGQTIQVGRWVILPSFGLLALALSWLAYRSGGWLAALMALLLVSLSPLVFTFSRLVMAEVPATALAVTSVVLLFLYLEQKRKIWLVTSGLVLGLSFNFKALNPVVVAPIGLLLWQESGVRGRGLGIRSRYFLFDSLVWAIGLIIPLAAVPLIYDPAAVYDQLIRFRGDLRTAIPGSTAETWDQFQMFLSSHWGFWLLAFGSIMAAVLRAWAEREHGTAERGAPSGGAEEQRRIFSNPSNLPAFQSPWLLYQLIWLVWLIAGMAMLWWHTPLFPHHFIILLPPLILLGANLIPQILTARRRRSETANEQVLTRPLADSSAMMLILMVIVVVAAFNIPAMVKADQETAAIVTGGRETKALQLLKAVSAPDDFVMGDSQLLIFMAGRRTPPPLGDVALVAIKAGRQTSSHMIGLAEQYQAPAVVQWSLRLPWLPEYLAWVEANYLTRRVWDNDHIIYFGLRLPPGQPVPNERTVHLGDSLALRGFQLAAGPVKAGRDLNMKVYWQTDAPMAEDYTIFTQLLDSQGTQVAGWDSQPLGGYFPTSQWPAGEIVTDIVRLPLPTDLAPGDYTLITGMYRLDTLARLHTADGDFVSLTKLSVE